MKLKASQYETKYNFFCHCWSFGCLMIVCSNKFLLNLPPSIFSCSPFLTTNNLILPSPTNGSTIQLTIDLVDSTIHNSYATNNKLQ